LEISGNEEIIKEGLARLAVPKLEYYKRSDGAIEPAWMPVFYNPQAVVSRDFTIIFLKIVMRNKEFFFVDALSGTGIRGIRIALESSGRGIVNDVDPRAHYYIKKNIELNDLSSKLEAYNHEANTLLNTLVFTGVLVDYVDVDPYGSPVPYIDSALKPLGKEAYLGVTATDTGPLTCTYPRKALIRYWNKCVKLDFEKEYAARLLISNIVLRASALEIEATPLLTLLHKYYIRVFFRTRRSATRAHSTVSECIGYIWYCDKTLERGFVRNVEDLEDAKCSDGSKPIPLGKTWICSLYDQDTISRSLAISKDTYWVSRESLKILELINSEKDINTPYIRLDKLCAALKTNMPSINTLLSRLKEAGIKCSRTHMDPRGIKAEADHETLSKFILDLAR